MYEELGVTGLNMPTASGNAEGSGSVNSASAAAAAAAATAAALAGSDYYQSYQNYPYGSSNYMSSFNYSTNGPVASNYDRTSMYVNSNITYQNSTNKFKINFSVANFIGIIHTTHQLLMYPILRLICL